MQHYVTEADYIKAVQAFHIIGLMSLVMAAVIAGLAAAKEDKQRLRFAAVLLFLTGKAKNFILAHYCSLSGEKFEKNGKFGANFSKIF